VARLAGQREGYLNKALAEFSSGQRVGYTGAMSEALVGLKAEELDDALPRACAVDSAASINEMSPRWIWG